MRPEEEIQNRWKSAVQKVVEAEEAMRQDPREKVGPRRVVYSFYKHEEELLRWVLGQPDGIKVKL